MSARKWILLVYSGVLMTAIAGVQIEIQNLEKELARERSDSNRAMAAAVAQFEHDLFTKNGRSWSSPLCGRRAG